MTVIDTPHRPVHLAAVAALVVLLAGCASSGEGTESSAATTAATTSSVAIASSSAPTSSPTTSPTSPAPPATTSTTSVAGSVVNTWSGALVDPTRLPIGDSSVTTSGPGVGKLWACRAGNPNAGGAHTDGPWLDVAAGTWNATTKLAVDGAVSWPTAVYTETVRDGQRILTTNDLPVGGQTGVFPIATDDPSYAYDRNPGTITERPTTVTLTAAPTAAASPSCLSEGPVAMLRNGVFVFSALDARNEDAVAHESQDRCDGHPAMTTYHYHNVPSCIRNATTGPSTVVGWALDGFPIVVERDPTGALPTNADLDECHGRTSPILLDGAVVTTYHYSATLEFPYFMGCYRGTAVSTRR